MSQLKQIAMLFMLIDHFAYVMIGKGVGTSGNWYMIYKVMRGMGRVAFPIFCFNIVEGFQKTRDVKAYLKRLIVFAIISEIPFDIAFRGELVNLEYQNVFWTLAFGLGAIMLYEDYLMTPWLKTLGLLGCFYIPYLVHTDYSCYGVMTIFLMYLFRKEPIHACMAGYIMLLLMSKTEVWAIFGFLLILLYNGERGRGNKILCYVFYPAHLMLLIILKPYITSFMAGLAFSVVSV